MLVQAEGAQMGRSCVNENQIGALSLADAAGNLGQAENLCPSNRSHIQCVLVGQGADS